MKITKSLNKVSIILLSVLFLVSVFEITVYFFYIYKPASRLYGDGKSYPLEIPAVSQLLKPLQIADGSLSLDDSDRAFQNQKLSIIKSELDTQLKTNNTFIKDSTFSYIYGGKVERITTETDGTIKVLLNNSTGKTLTKSFTQIELTKISVVLYTLSQKSPSRSITTLDQAKTEDYIIVKVSDNLLIDSPTKTEIEIFRVVK